MKNINKFLFAFLGLALLSSCSEDEDATDQRIVKSVVTVDQTTFSITEGETATVTMTTNTPLNVRSDFKLELVGGTGSFIDYTVEGDNNADTDDETSIDDGYGIIGHKVTLPAYATTSTFDITPFLDFFPEGTETLIFRLYPMGNSTTLVDAASETITVTVANGTSNDVVTVVDWSQNYRDSFGTLTSPTYLASNESSYEYCDYDFDLEIYDGAFNYFDTSYDFCPETLTILSTDPDDTYYIAPSFWTNVVATGHYPVEEIAFKVKVTIAKPGVWVYETNYNDQWNSTDGGSAQGNPDGFVVTAALIKTGSTYVLEDFNTGDVLASGKQANIKSRLPKRTKK